MAASQSEENSAADSSEEQDSQTVSVETVMEDQYVVHSHNQGEFHTHPPQFTTNTKEDQGGHQVRTVELIAQYKPLQCNAVVSLVRNKAISSHQATWNKKFNIFLQAGIYFVVKLLGDTATI